MFLAGATAYGRRVAQERVRRDKILATIRYVFGEDGLDRLIENAKVSGRDLEQLYVDALRAGIE